MNFKLSSSFRCFASKIFKLLLKNLEYLSALIIENQIIIFCIKKTFCDFMCQTLKMHVKSFFSFSLPFLTHFCIITEKLLTFNN